ncbi:MAG: hypothetical protein L6408_05875, partial [Nanoarchaeota archaeon]|nr:hypothetical protein [Nanoarchaeota archaeon]
EDNIGSTLSVTFVYYYNQGLYQISGRRNLDGVKEVPVRTIDLDTAYGLLETRLRDISNS